MPDHMWSPWRMRYIKGDARTPGDGCIFCEKINASDDAAAHVLARGQYCFVTLNLYPYNNGHLMVVPYRHESSLAALSRDEMDEIGLLVQRSETVLREAYRLDGINVGVNLGAPAGAGIEEHVHVHLVPRWSGDTNFMTVIGQTRVLPENLLDTAARMRPIFQRLAGEQNTEAGT